MKQTMQFQTRIFITALAMLVVVTTYTFAQDRASAFKVGEKLSYTLSFGNFKDGGYAEMYVASSGKIGGREVIELRSRVKTIGVVSASFLLVDEARTVFADPVSGVPLFIKKTEYNGPIPRQRSVNMLAEPPANFDILTMLYQVRASGGSGTFSFFDAERNYTVTFKESGQEHFRTDAGEFDTIRMSVKSDYLAARGIRDMRIFFSADEDRIPVFMQFKAQSTELQAMLSAVSYDAPSAATPDPTVKPTPIPANTPIPIPTPRPSPTQAPYVDNQPLLSELGFQLGEKLNYRVSQNDQMLATVVLEAVERKKFERRDSLLLTATVTGVDKPNPYFRPGDHLFAQVDPETLAPFWVEGKFGPSLEPLNQTLIFDARTGVNFGGQKTVDVPVGTHAFLSLLYAMRSFNLQHSRDDRNPINDTRVAVFFQDKPYVFTLRPVPAADITINGTKVSAQQISVTTQNPLLDTLGLKVYLDAETRIPLRITAGVFKADLVTQQ